MHMHKEVNIKTFYCRFTSQEEDSLLGALRKLRRLADVKQLADGDDVTAMGWSEWTTAQPVAVA